MPRGVDLRNDCWPGDDCFMTCSGPQVGKDPECVKAEAGTQCSPPRCVDESHSQGPAICADYGAVCPESVVADCGAYACNIVDGACRDACAVISDCAPGYVCQKGECAAPPPVSQGEDASCAFAPPARSGAGGALIASVVAALAAALRRRRARRAH
jgi:hypothetical protein